MSRRQITPPLVCTFDEVYAALATLPQATINKLVTTGGVEFSATANVTRDGRHYIGLPQSNRIYGNDWGYSSNSMGKDGQRIGQYAKPLDQWCLEFKGDSAGEHVRPVMSTKDIVESYRTVFLEGRPMVADLRTSARARLIWFVGISGYALLNAKPYWEAMGQRTFAGPQLIWLSLPWILTALFSVMTHFLIDETGAKDNLYFINKLAMIDLHRMEIAAGVAHSEDFLRIVQDNHIDISSLRRSTDRWSTLTRWCERFAFASLVAGFIWAAIGPLVIP
jgi:hypothetical protein